MKQQDAAVVIAIVFLAGIFSFFISATFITPSDKKLTTEVVSPITTDFQLPSSEVFNTEAINPTVRIEIAPTNNNQPFTE